MGSKPPRKKRLSSLIIGILAIVLGIIFLILSASANTLSAIGYILLSAVLLMGGSIILIIRYFTAPIPAAPPPKPEKTVSSFQSPPVRDRPVPKEAVVHVDPRAACSEGLQLPLSSYIVLDIETTGLSPERDFIIEFGAIKVENGEETASFQTFIDPGCPIPRRITEITGITDADLAGAPSLLPAIHMISDFIGDVPIVAHNASFDLGFLRQAYAAAGLPVRFDVIDTLRLARKAFPDAPNHKLATLIDFLHLGGSQAHRALSDVRYTDLVYRACLNAGIAVS